MCLLPLDEENEEVVETRLELSVEMDESVDIENRKGSVIDLVASDGVRGNANEPKTSAIPRKRGRPRKSICGTVAAASANSNVELREKHRLRKPVVPGKNAVQRDDAESSDNDASEKGVADDVDSDVDYVPSMRDKKEDDDDDYCPKKKSKTNKSLVKKSPSLVIKGKQRLM